jgi:predicted O-methyltransferase YrrM
MGLKTLLGLRRQGFFIPYRYADTLPGAGQRTAYAPAEALMARREPQFAAVLDLIDGYGADLQAIGAEPPPAPRWTQDWFPRLDGASAYALVRHHKPARIVEVGSGHSTRFLVRAAADEGLEAQITAIDPAPRATLEGLDVTFLRRTLQQAGGEAFDVFDALAAGDVLFIDSSHILMPGSDVDMLFNRVMPNLPAGVIVHIHDIFLPDDYPAPWEWRGYNEQLGVVPLLFGGGYEVLFASHYAATRMAGRVKGGVLGGLPLSSGAWETSLWLRKAV